MPEGFETKERAPKIETEISPEQFEETIRTLEKSDSQMDDLERFAKQ